MSLLTFSLPESGKPDLTEDPKVTNALTAILAWAAGQISGSNIKSEGIEGSNVNKEIPKLTAGAVYVKTEVASAAEFTPSATRPSKVNAVAKSKAGLAASLVVKVNGEDAAIVESLAAASGVYNMALSVDVPAGGIVKVTTVNGEGNIVVRTLVE